MLLIFLMCSPKSNHGFRFMKVGLAGGDRKQVQARFGQEMDH